MLKVDWTGIPRSGNAQGPHFCTFFMRGYIKNVLNTIKPVTFTARKYGKAVKLAEHRNERMLNTLGSPTETDKETIKWKEFKPI